MFTAKKPKKIAIDATPILANYFRGAGISKYIVNLFNKVLEIDKTNHYFLYFRNNFHDKLIKDYSYENVKFKKILIPDRILDFLWNYTTTSNLIENLYYHEIDIYISTTYFTPSLPNKVCISFIYDITPLKSPVVTKQYRKYFAERLLKTVRRSDFFITISNASKNDFVNLFSIRQNTVFIIYPIISSRFCKFPSKESVKEVLKKYNLDLDKYFLYVGVRGENKNLLNAVKAFHMLITKYGIPHKFVFVGRPDVIGKTDLEIINFAKTHQIEDRIVLLNYVPDEELPFFYNGAEVFVFPSFYEGFGMPVVEAMSCGVPVAVSNTASLPEVVEDSAVMFDPHNPNSIADAIYKLIADKTFTSNLVLKGLQRSKIFQSEKSAVDFIQLINSL